MNLEIRWMIRKDMDEVTEIERLCYDNPWNLEDFLTHLRQRNIIGYVAIHKNDVVGFLIYELHKEKIVLINLAIHPELQRKKVATIIIDKMKEKIHQQPSRNSLFATVSEDNLKAQLFFKRQGFKAFQIIKRYFANNLDGYCFGYRVNKQEQENRITKYEKSNGN